MSDDVDDFLAHFGVKGMKWGVRKTPEKSNRRVNLEGKYIRKGMSLAEAEVAATKRLQTEKIIAAAALTTVAALATYAVARKIGRDYLDVKLKEGTLFQHVTDSKDIQFNESPVFTTYKNVDKKDIHALFPKEYSVDLKATTAITAPSRYKARKMLSEVLGKEKVMSSSEYAKFNYGYFYKNDPESKRVVDEFFGKIKDAGYNSLLDPKPSGYRNVTGSVGRLHKPLIVLDGSRSVIKTGEKYISDLERSKYMDGRRVREITTTSLNTTIAGSFFVGSMAYTASLDRNRAINDYIRKNPNSGLSRSELSAKYSRWTNKVTI